MIIKVELIFVGDKKLRDAIKEHLADSIQKDFIEGEEKFVIKSIQVLKK